MRTAVVVVCLVVFVGANVLPPWIPPNINKAPPLYLLDISLAPEQRWVGAVQSVIDTHGYENSVAGIIDTLRSVYQSAGCAATGCEDVLANTLQKTYPESYAECAGIAQVIQQYDPTVTQQELAAFQYMYEMQHISQDLPAKSRYGCTAVIAQDSSGHIFQGRNLDMTLLVAINTTYQTSWKVNGKVAFYSAQLIGDTGVFTGTGPQFTVSTNWRYINYNLATVLNCVTGGTMGAPFGAMIRSMYIEGASFEEAVNKLNNTQLCGANYFTVSGSQPGQGVVLSRTMETSDYPLWLDVDKQFYLVQTNYDYWSDDYPWYDNRKALAEKKLQQLGQDLGASFGGVMDVLSTVHDNMTRGVLNGGTIFTSVSANNADNPVMGTVLRHHPPAT